MAIINSCARPLSRRFFAPLDSITASCRSARSCPELSDDAWLRVGITRTLEDEPSGRAFLQTLSADWEDVPANSTFFDTLASPRRMRLCREVNAALFARMAAICWIRWPRILPCAACIVCR